MKIVRVRAHGGCTHCKVWQFPGLTVLKSRVLDLKVNTHAHRVELATSSLGLYQASFEITALILVAVTVMVKRYREYQKIHNGKQL